MAELIKRKKENHKLILNTFELGILFDEIFSQCQTYTEVEFVYETINGILEETYEENIETYDWEE
jgi:hypothetical protein